MIFPDKIVTSIGFSMFKLVGDNVYLAFGRKSVEVLSEEEWAGKRSFFLVHGREIVVRSRKNISIRLKRSR